MIAFVLLLCSQIAAAEFDFTALSASEVEDLLEKWNLHDHFGKAFRDLKYDGRFLHVLTAEDFDKELFPQASKAHWKVLLHEIKQTKKSGFSPARRLKAEIDTKNFQGVRIVKDNSIVTFGKGQDIKLVRTGPGKLTLYAKSFEVASLSAKSITLDSKDLKGGGGGGGDITKLLSAFKPSPCTIANSNKQP